MKIIIIFSALLFVTLATKGVDVAGYVDNFSCLKSNGMSFAITRGYCSYGAVDTDGKKNLVNIKNAGMTGDVYFFPCRGISAQSQVDQFVSYYSGNGEYIQGDEPNDLEDIVNAPKGMRAGYAGADYMDRIVKEEQSFERQLEEEEERIRYIPGSDSNGDNYGTVWLDVEINPKSSCSWANYSGSSNCEYVHQLVNALKGHGKRVGIYASLYMWETVMGSRYACSDLSGLDLWYAHYDNSPSFSDYSSLRFGGWTQPAIKQYVGDTYLCGDGVDLNFY